jgi:hypothetical protein
MMHAFSTKIGSLLLCGSLMLLGGAPAQAQLPKQVLKKAGLVSTISDTSRRVPTVREPLPQPQRKKTAAYRNGLCDLLTNGDFEIQTTLNSGPTRYNNLAGGFGTPSTANQNNFQAPIPTELAGWTSPTAGTPDYYATNGAVDVNPPTGIYARFTPFSARGSIGLGSLQPYAQYDFRASEYVSTQIPVLAQGRYYAELRAQPSDGGTYAANNPGNISANASTRGVSSGFGLQVSNGPFPGANANMRDFLIPTQSTRGVLNNGTAGQTINDVTRWTRVSGQFDVSGTENFNTLTVGLFNPSPNVLVPLPGITSDFPRTYIIVDNVELFRIPTAGPSAACGATIGEGCSIPYASYSWSPAAGLSNANSLNPVANPSATTIYTLTVTLPDGSTHATSTTVNGCGCPTPNAPQIQTPAWTCTNSFGPVYVVIANYDPNLTYLVTTTNNLENSPPGITGRYVNGQLKWVFQIRSDAAGQTGRVTVKATNTCGNFNTTSFNMTSPACSGRKQMAATSYPNPSQDYVQTPLGAQSVRLLDGQGKQVQVADESGRVFVRSLPEGLYYLHMKLNGKVVNQRIQVMR